MLIIIDYIDKRNVRMNNKKLETVLVLNKRKINIVKINQINAQEG